MRVIKIENNEVTEVKQMLPHYILKDGEIVSLIGEYGQIYNPETGEFSDYVPTPEEIAEQQKQEQMRQICDELDQAILFNDTEEITRCRQAYADLNNGVTIKTKAEVEAELVIARTESDELLIAYLTAKGVIV